jgi:CHAT domain-containing protein/tetratricopeptide (TPR) repeat protein
MKYRHIAIGLGSWLLCVSAADANELEVHAPNRFVQSVQTPSSNAQLQQGRQLYEAGQFAEAVRVLQQAVETFTQQGQLLDRAIANSNLSLAYQQLGDWSAAEAAIATSLETLAQLDDRDRETRSILAQSLHVQGQLQLSIGQAETAADTWERAIALYQSLEDETGVLSLTIDRAEALQALGLYKQALAALTDATQTLQSQSDSPLKAKAYLSLGNTQRSIGKLEASDGVASEVTPSYAELSLRESLSIAHRLQLPDAIARAALSWGNTKQSIARRALDLGDRPKYSEQLQAALESYDIAVRSAGSTSDTQVLAQLNQLSLQVERHQWDRVKAVLPQLHDRIDRLPVRRQTVYARVNLARSALKAIEQQPKKREDVELMRSSQQIAAQMLTVAIEQAKSLGDNRAQSYALGTLGQLYLYDRDWQAAQAVTEEALLLSQAMQAGDIAYQWQWQLGRILCRGVQPCAPDGDLTSAIAAYREAVNTLKTIRNDLVTVTSDVQFSFREGVEPVYRQLVDLLLQPTPGETRIDLERLEWAREAIEALQLAQLDNFFREACIEAKPVNLEALDRQAAAIYSIVLPDRLETIVSLPGKPLRHYTQPVSAETVKMVAAQVRASVIRGDQLPSAPVENKQAIRPVLVDEGAENDSIAPSEQLYDWLVRPVAAELAASEVKTLVFVLDNPLQNLPLSVLHDGRQYLIENYAIAQTPGLQVLPTTPIEPTQLKVLAGGLSMMPPQFRSQWGDLAAVEGEVNSIGRAASGQILLNDAFTSQRLQAQLGGRSFQIVHLATHGQFSSNLAETFVLAWDGEIGVGLLTDLLQVGEETRRTPIELLVLSACQTAVGDDRAALGLAGVAVRAGARSTLASLWLVDDRATAQLMAQFYQESIDNPSLNKAQALRNAQLSLLKSSEFNLPQYWAAFVLVGNWK